jgi:MFS family permease
MVHTYELSIPVLLPIWLAEFSVIDVGLAQFPLNEATIGALVTVGFALFGLGALPSGVLVDRVDARVLITTCLVGMGTSFLLLALSPTPAVIGLAVAVWGVAASVYHPSGLSLISRGVEQRGSAFAYHGMAGNVGIAVGPLLTILLLLAFDWRVVVAILAVPAALAAVYAFRVDIDERAAVAAADGGTDADAIADGDSRANEGIDSLGGFLTQSRQLFAGAFVVVFAVTLCSGLYYRGVLTFLPELLDGLEIAALEPIELGSRTLQPSRYVYVGLLMVGVGGQFVAGKLTDRGRPEFGIFAGFAALAAVALLFLPAAALGLPALLVVSALLGFFLFFVQPFYQASVAEYTPAGSRGLSYGFSYLGVFGVGALGATLAGTMLTYFAPRQLFVVLAGLALLAAGIGAFLVTRVPSTAAGT